jgi:alpha-L-fucosidase
MNKYGYTLYKSKQGFISPQPWGVTTNIGKIHYIHILDKNISTLALNIPGFQSAKAVNLEQPVVWKKDKKTGEIVFTFKGDLDDIDSIIEVKVK